MEATDASKKFTDGKRSADQIVARDEADLKNRDANASGHGRRVEQAEARVEQAEARVEQAEARTEQAEARTEQSEARTEQAVARTEQAEARTEQSEARTEQAVARTEQAEARTEQAVARTEQVETQSEEAIRASELRYRRLFEAARDGILILDADTGRITDVNPFLIELLGFSLSQMVGKTVGELSPFKDIESNKAMLERLQRDGYVRYEDLPLETTDNRKIDVEFVSNVYQVGDKKVIQCNIRNITERKRAQEEIRRLNVNLEQRVVERTAQLQVANQVLRVSEERFRLFVDAVQDYAIIMLSPQGLVTSWNEGAEYVKGYKAEEIIGKHFSCFYPPEDITRGKPEKELQTVLEQGHLEADGWRVRKDGQKFWANVVMTAVFDNNGCLQGFAKITRDMTERKRLEEILRNKNIELQNAAEAKDKFLANMSHELRTPLNGIIGFGEFLVDGKPGPVNAKQKDCLEEILNSSKHLLNLINDILDLAKVRAGKIEFHPERFSLRKAIEEACAVAKPIAQKKNIPIDVNVAPEIGEVTLDQQKFKQVIIQPALQRDQIQPRWRQGGNRPEPYDTDRFKLVVSDTGIGIKAEEAGAAFQRVRTA